MADRISPSFGIRVFIQERLGRHDHARRAEATLNGPVLNEHLLDGMEPVSLPQQTLHSDDRPTRYFKSGVKAGIDAHPVHQHRAGPAFPLAASLFGARELKGLPQDMEEHPVTLHLGRHLLPIERKPYLFLRGVLRPFLLEVFQRLHHGPLDEDAGYNPPVDFRCPHVRYGADLRFHRS